MIPAEIFNNFLPSETNRRGRSLVYDVAEGESITRYGLELMTVNGGFQLNLIHLVLGERISQQFLFDTTGQIVIYLINGQEQDLGREETIKAIESLQEHLVLLRQPNTPPPGVEFSSVVFGQ